MFTGIIEELGTVGRIQKKGSLTLLEINAVKTMPDTKLGDSIAVNGACLTVTGKSDSRLSFEVMPETMSITNLGRLRVADKVNLERALRVGDRLSGHFVLGHVDSTGVIVKRYHKAGNECLDIRYPAQFVRYVLPKGSVAVDGISLTIAEKRSTVLSVYLIPHTLHTTTLGFKNPSDCVNLELDILAKRPL